MADLFDKESLEIICPKCKKKIKQPVAWFQTKQNALPSFASPNQYSGFRKGIADATKAATDLLKPR